VLRAQREKEKKRRTTQLFSLSSPFLLKLFAKKNRLRAQKREREKEENKAAVNSLISFSLLALSKKTPL
jgi:hypothetical protein